MDEEEKELLLRTAKLSEENNRILRGMVRREQWGYVWSAIKLAVIVGPIIYGYIYFIQPMLQKVNRIYSLFDSNASSSLVNVQWGPEIMKALKQIKW